jgi:hypothetical protein
MGELRSCAFEAGEIMNGVTQDITQQYMAVATESVQLVARYDVFLEHNSMRLLAKIDKVDRRLNDTKGQTSRLLVLECLVDLVNHLVQFAEELPVPETEKCSLETLTAERGNDYRQLRPSHMRSNRLMMDDLQRDIMQNPDTFFALSNDLLRAANYYLGTFVKAFRSPRVSQQWRTLYTAFLKGIVMTIRGLQVKQPL